MYLDSKGVWRDDKGNKAKFKLKIPVITADDKKNQWDIVRGLVEDYARLHPQEVASAIRLVRDIRIQLAMESNKEALGRENKVQHALKLPEGLLTLLVKTFPDLFQDSKNVIEFGRRFPAFQVAEGVYNSKVK